MPGAFPNVFFTEDNIPDWYCPACLNASLEVVPGSFLTHLSSFSLQNRDKDWYDVDHEEFVFTCMLQCSRRSCKESVAVSGTGRAEQDHDERMELLQYYNSYKAKSFVPPLPVFNVPENCPEDIVQQLKMVSALLPISGAATVNAMRITLEMLLDEQGVPNKTADYIPLAHRIEQNKDKLGKHYDAFHALKDFGNHGSHTNGRIRRSDIEGACQVLDHLIRQLYAKEEDHSAIVATLRSRYAKKPKGAL